MVIFASYKTNKKKCVLFIGLLFGCSYLLAYLITSPINSLNKKIIANKQFMILNKDGICKEVIIPDKGKNYKFSCDVIRK